MARSITTRRPLWVEEVDFGDGTIGLRDRRNAGRLRAAGEPRTGRGLQGRARRVAASTTARIWATTSRYSGTVAAALEAIVLGLPGIAVSQQSSARELDFTVGRRVRLRHGGDVHRAARGRARERAAAGGHAAQHQRPGRHPDGRRGRASSASASTATSWRWSTRRTAGRRLYRIYGDASYERDETGTDLAAVAQGKIAVTPIHFDLTDRERPRRARALRPGAADRAGGRGGRRRRR